MFILNFTHPLTDEHKAHIEPLAGTPIDEIRQLEPKLDLIKEFRLGELVAFSRFPFWDGLVPNDH
jgi:hypothetical protein